MKRLGWGKLVAFVAAGSAIIVGAVLLAAQAPMNEMHDAAAFESDAIGLYSLVEQGKSREASQAFHALRRAQDTGKNDMFDLGAGLIACGGLALLVAALTSFSAAMSRFFTQTHGPLLVPVVSALLGIMMSQITEQQIFATFNRFEVPPWADSLGIPLAGVVPIGIMTFLFFGIIAGVPHIPKRLPGVSLAAMPSKIRVGSVIALMVYGPLAVGFLLLAVLTIGASAGWLMAPAMMIAAWLMLHARAVTAE